MDHIFIHLIVLYFLFVRQIFFLYTVKTSLTYIVLKCSCFIVIALSFMYCFEMIHFNLSFVFRNGNQNSFKAIEHPRKGFYLYRYQYVRLSAAKMRTSAHTSHTSPGCQPFSSAANHYALYG